MKRFEIDPVGVATAVFTFLLLAVGLSWWLFFNRIHSDALNNPVACEIKGIYWTIDTPECNEIRDSFWTRKESRPFQGTCDLKTKICVPSE